MEITALEVSLILWDVQVLSWSALPHRREHKFGKMRLTEHSAVKKETDSARGRWDLICRFQDGMQNDRSFQIFFINCPEIASVVIMQAF